MGKRIFSITCTTCQARLVVRSESAIGAILECPRCQSMVEVTPPPGWRPTAPPPEPATPPVGPPPLDRVTTVPLSLELELSGTSTWATLLSPIWLVLGGAVLTLGAVFVGLWWLLPPRSAPQPVPAATSAADDGQTPNETHGPLETPSGDAAPESDTPRRKPNLPDAIPNEPAPTPSTQPTRDQEDGPGVADKKASTVAVNPATPDLLPAVADKPADDAKQVEVKKAPPAQVDVAARLGDPIAKIEWTDMPLVKAVGLLAAMGNFPVTIDADALLQLGIAPSDPISLDLDSTSIAKALRAVVSQKGLAVKLENGQVLVGSPAEYRETLQKVRYTVADLTGDDEAATAELAALAKTLVAPDSWQTVGGRGTIEHEKGALVVQQASDVQQQILVFCEKLRTARHKPLRSRDPLERLELTTRWAQARKMLTQPVSVNFHEPTPLGKVLVFLGETADVDILVDHAALAAAETSDRVEAALSANKRAFGAALDDLLRPLGLTYRLVGSRAIQVTTTEAADERLELEFYPVGPWLAKQGLGGPALAERLKSRIAASTWSDVGGPAEVYFDPASECLIVLQSPPAQAAIERMLATKVEGVGKAD